VIDLVLVALMIGYAVSGYRQGLLVGTLSLGGFVGGAVLAMWLVPELFAGLEPGPQRALVVLLGVILMAWLGQFLGALVGSRLRDGVSQEGPAAAFDQVSGAVAGVVAVALVAWFVAGAVRGGPSPAVSRAVGDSHVLRAIDSVVPGQFAEVAEAFRGVVGGSTFPRVFAGVGAEQITPIQDPDPDVVQTVAVERAQASIVKITGDAPSCGRGQEGSGVVVAPKRVVTNAHVVAGVRRPKVQVGGEGRRYSASVVAFDAQRDLAVLAVPALPSRAEPLALGTPLTRGDDAVVAGFPNDGPFLATAARVRSILRATGEDIYGQPGAVRQVYSLNAEVEPGNSGGPVLSPDGEVVGIVFAKSLDDDSTGYALTLEEVRPVIRKGVEAADPVSTGACAIG
jgi:S1-C subfamily serine protease